MSTTPLDLSVIIPAYNEAARIEEAMESIASFFAERAGYDELLVVDDGSFDNTVEVVEGYRNSFERLRIISYKPNRGKGYAVREGMLAARGAHRLFMDADNSTDVREYMALRDALEGHVAGVVVGSTGEAKTNLEAGQSRLRTLLGTAASAFIGCLVDVDVGDTQRGFKLLTAEAAAAVFPLCKADGWTFDVELLALAKGLGFTALEVPVVWKHVDDSKVTARAYFLSLVEVFQISRNVKRTLQERSDMQ